MNRNVLKVVAVVSMLLDHIGAFIFPEQAWLRIVGRIAFPIFAFFIAEGLKYTKNKERYILTLIVCAVISQIPFALLMDWYNLNTIFTFLIAILLIYLIENCKKNSVNILIICLITLILVILEFVYVFDYGIFGILLIISFYFCKNKKLAIVFAGTILILLSLKNIILSNFVISSYHQFASFFALVLLAFYNGDKGKFNLKYFFYVFYPVHLIVIYIISLI